MPSSPEGVAPRLPGVLRRIGVDIRDQDSCASSIPPAPDCPRSGCNFPAEAAAAC